MKIQNITVIFFTFIFFHSLLYPAFESIDKSAEAVKTAEACTVKYLGVTSAFYNPGIFYLQALKEINGQYARPLMQLQNDSLTYFNLMLAYPFKKIKFGLSLNRLQSDLFSEQSVSFTAAGKLLQFHNKDIASGIRIKLLKMSYEENDYTRLDQLFIENGNSRSVMSFDWGLTAYEEKGFSIGFVLQNINSPDITLAETGQSLPLQVRTGVSYKCPLKNKTLGVNDISTEFDFHYQKYGYSFHWGIEPAMFDYVFYPGLGFAIGNNSLRYITAGLTYQLAIEGFNYQLRAFSYFIRINYAFRFYLAGFSAGTYGDHFVSVSFLF